MSNCWYVKAEIRPMIILENNGRALIEWPPEMKQVNETINNGMTSSKFDAYDDIRMIVNINDITYYLHAMSSGGHLYSIVHSD